MIALAYLILFFAFPGRTYYVAPGLIMPKIYANSIMAVLNARFNIVGGRSTYSPGSDSTALNTIPSCILRDSDGISSIGGCPNNVGPAIVSIRKEVFSDRDSEEPLEMKATNVRFCSRIDC